jgi:hypothetical protein
MIETNPAISTPLPAWVVALCVTDSLSMYRLFYKTPFLVKITIRVDFWGAAWRESWNRR